MLFVRLRDGEIVVQIYKLQRERTPRVRDTKLYDVLTAIPKRKETPQMFMSSIEYVELAVDAPRNLLKPEHTHGSIVG